MKSVILYIFLQKIGVCVFFFLPAFSTHTPKCQQLSSCRFSCLDELNATLLLSYDVAHHVVAITSFKLLKSVENGLVYALSRKNQGRFLKKISVCVCFFFSRGFPLTHQSVNNCHHVRSRAWINQVPYFCFHTMPHNTN